MYLYVTVFHWMHNNGIIKVHVKGFLHKYVYFFEQMLVFNKKYYFWKIYWQDKGYIVMNTFQFVLIFCLPLPCSASTKKYFVCCRILSSKPYSHLNVRQVLFINSLTYCIFSHEIHYLSYVSKCTGYYELSGNFHHE